MISKVEPVLIVGAGVAGGVVANVLGDSRKNKWLKPIGFVDDDPKKQKLILNGLPVLGKSENVPELVDRYDIKKIIIAMPSASGQAISRIIELCHQTGARLKILPGFYDLIAGRVKTTDIRDVEVGDLLGREPVSLNVEQIAGYLTGRNVLVTGAGGSIGSELSRQVARFFPEQLIILGRGENSIYEIELELRDNFPDLQLIPEIGDIKDRARMDRIFGRYRPDVVFHAAAHKHVPFMELCPDEAVKNNILGTKNVAEAAWRAGVGTFILISSDKAVNPASIMGATKRVAEMVIQNMDEKGGTRFAAVRFGNVLGSRGSVIPLFKRQIARGGPVTITHPDMERYFMTTIEAAQLVIQAGAQAGGGEIFILDMGQPVKILELSHKLIRLSGFEPEADIPVQFTGIRSGEKLVEQLVDEDEGIIATGHGRISAVSGRGLDISLLEASLNILESPDFSFQEQDTIVLLQKLIPDFRK
ncbi:MAG: UDP-N-acetyl-alpha-D-glucosamine C6 dehydratase [Pelotomaculum sp. PtaU1.Bin035]|nr:MAG: UDP-N-acetyl-alpha-D-glucosamine C6 dehydratase [Pelotomaculum sp. PtaU1.Bin035]